MDFNFSFLLQEFKDYYFTYNILNYFNGGVLNFILSYKIIIVYILICNIYMICDYFYERKIIETRIYPSAGNFIRFKKTIDEDKLQDIYITYEDTFYIIYNKNKYSRKEIESYFVPVSPMVLIFIGECFGPNKSIYFKLEKINKKREGMNFHIITFIYPLKNILLLKLNKNLFLPPELYDYILDFIYFFYLFLCNFVYFVYFVYFVCFCISFIKMKK